jgi:HK97 family phage prohead protease
MGENRYRSAPYELREGTNGALVMTINFARFNEWTRIDSMFEGTFMERIAPGAFSKTIRESQPKVLFQHGRDPQIGDKPLGTITDIREEADGAWADVELLDASYVRDIAAGLKAAAYGASFAFQVVREDVNQKPGRSKDNADGIPEKTVRELRMREFGPVTFPAYEGTSAGIRSRSLTDAVLNAREQEIETSEESERTPAEPEQATSERKLLRFGDRYLIVGPNGTPGAQSTSRDDTNNENEGDADA